MLFALTQSSLFIAAIFIGRMDQYNPRYNFENNATQNLQPAEIRRVNNPVQRPPYQPLNPSPYGAPVSGPPISGPPVAVQPNPWEVRPQNVQYQPVQNENAYFPEDLPYDPRFSDRSEKKDNSWAA